MEAFFCVLDFWGKRWLYLFQPRNNGNLDKSLRQAQGPPFEKFKKLL
jgi:hypothetical protein